MAKSPTIHVKRIYDPPEVADGLRILVDRLWPRGVKKESAALDGWAKHLAPSTELRQWFAHEPVKFDTFRLRYRQELEKNTEAIAQFLSEAESETLTLLYAARDPSCNHAIILQEFLLESR